MKIEIQNHCIRCGICAGLYPQLFAHNFKEDCIDVKCEEVPEELERIAKQAAADCAVTAIFLKRDPDKGAAAKSTGVSGIWELSVNTPMGELKPTLTLQDENGVVTGTMCDGEHEPVEIVDGVFNNGELTFGATLLTPLGAKKIKMALNVDGDDLSGKAKILMLSVDVIGCRR